MKAHPVMSKKVPPSRSSESIQKAINLSAQDKDEPALKVIQTHLRKFPRDIEALNLAGTLAARMVNWPLAEKHFAATLALDKANTYALYSLSKVYTLSDRPGDAIELLTRLLQIEPGNVSALNEAGVLLVEEGRLDDALRAFETVIELDPSFEMAYRNLYVALVTRARYEEAVYVAKRAIEHISTDYRWNFRVDLIHCLWKTRVFDEARQSAERLLIELEHVEKSPQHDSNLLHTLINYGVVLMELDDREAAEVQFKRVLALDPHLIEPYVNLAKLCSYSEDFQGAIHWFDQALAIGPDHAELHNHLANFLRDAGRPDLALPHHYAAIALSPGNVEMHYYLGPTQFALGQLHEAYKNWELRWSRREGGAKSDLSIAEWTGTPETGRSILIYREQGIGDEIAFASCLPDVVDRFERIICVCHSKLKPLFARSFPKIEFRSGADALTHADIADMEWQIAIGSLLPIVRPNMESFPLRPQSFVPDPEKVAYFREQLAPKRTVLTIGIAWRSGLLSLNRRALYPYLEFWQDLFDIPGVTWVNLQYGDVTEELRKAEQQFGVSIVNFESVDHFDDIDASAALMKACDLVIGPDTSTIQIAAAVGVPTIGMSSGSNYFSLGLDHSPLFPSLNFILRKFGESWLGPIQRTASIVRVLATERSR
jgi:tetratricopeptide (TPR) repeat protein